MLSDFYIVLFLCGTRVQGWTDGNKAHFWQSEANSKPSQYPVAQSIDPLIGL